MSADAPASDGPPPLSVRPAAAGDHAAVLALLAALELDYPRRDLAHFHVGEILGGSGREIVAIAEVRPAGGALLLSCVGVREDLQRRGLGGRFVEALLDGVAADVRLFTIVPGFFRRLGFEPSDPPADLVRTEIYGCRDCFPERCRSLVRRAGARRGHG